MKTNASKTRGTAPAFQLYATDLMSKREYRLMSLAERGLLLTLMCECWVNRELPADAEELSSFIGKPVKEFLTNWLMSFFEITEDETIRCPDIEIYRDRVLDGRNRMSAGGRKGGNTRARNAKKYAGMASKIDQATLKGREPEYGIETGPELDPDPLTKGDISTYADIRG